MSPNPAVQVKVCGVRTPEGAQAAVDAGADLLGFILYPPARRYVPPERVRAILAGLRGRSGIRAVGVFVNQEPAHIKAVAESCGLDLVQCCGDEAPEAVRLAGRPALKVFRPGTGNAPDFAAYALHAALLEPPSGGWGGTGRALDWSLARAITDRPDRPPVFLAGGLRPETVAEAIRAVRPDGVDVSSGVERAGAQDPERIAAFVRAAKGAKL